MHGMTRFGKRIMHVTYHPPTNTQQKLRLGRNLDLDDGQCITVHFFARTSTHHSPPLTAHAHIHSPWRTKRENSSICEFSKSLTARMKSREVANHRHLSATCPASARLPVASSRPRTTPPSRSPSVRSMRMADTPAKTRHMRSLDLCAPWARATTA